MGYGTLKIKTQTEIMQQMVNYVVSNTDLTDLLEGSVLSQILAASARSDETLYFQVARLLDLFSLESAGNEDLDLRVADYNLVRETNIFSKGSGTFKRTSVADAFTVPSGTQVSTNGYTYKTTDAAVFGAGSATSGAVGIVSEMGGSTTNAPSSSSVKVVTTFNEAAATGLTFTLTTDITGGRNAETDKSLRARAKHSIRKLNRTSPDSLKAICLTSAIGNDKCTSANVVESIGTPGLVKIYVDNGSGMTPTENVITDESLIASATGGETRFRVQNIPIKWLGGGAGANAKIEIKKNGAVLTQDTDYWVKTGTGQIVLNASLAASDALTATYTYFSGLVQEIQKTIDGNASDTSVYKGGRAAGVDVVVLAPTPVTPTIAATVTVESSFDGTTVRTNVQSAIINYINALDVGEDVILAQIMEEGMSIAGVTNMIITNPAPANPAADIAIADNENARASITSVTVS